MNSLNFIPLDLRNCPSQNRSSKVSKMSCSGAIIERNGYPGYDMDSLTFDMDDPDFGTIRNNAQIHNENLIGIHIRHSKSDSLLVSATQSFYQATTEDFDNSPAHYRTHHRYSVFTIGKNNNSTENDYCTPIDATMLTIEGLKNHYNSCFTCGVSWYEDHVTLDCSECGGYSMQRPCPQCEGQCESIWSRDLPASHKAHKAQWMGECKKCDQHGLLHGLLQKATLSPDACDTFLSKALDQLKTPL